MTKDKPGRREPFIARRDESAPLQAGFTEPKEKPRASSSEAASEPKKLGFIVLCFLVGLLSLSLGALSAFSWRQSQSQAILQHEFDDLALRLASSDESVAQSGAALTIKLNQQEETLAQHWSEIKKLWGVANDRNKKAIKALQLADREATNNLKKIQHSHASLEKNVDGVHAALKNVQAEIKKMSSASLVANAQTDDFHNQLKSLEGKIKTFDSEASDLRKLIEKNRQSQSQRLTEFEQAVKSMDAFRRQTNEKFSRLHPASSGN